MVALQTHAAVNKKYSGKRLDCDSISCLSLHVYFSKTDKCIESLTDEFHYINYILQHFTKCLVDYKPKETPTHIKIHLHFYITLNVQYTKNKLNMIGEMKATSNTSNSETRKDCFYPEKRFQFYSK